MDILFCVECGNSFQKDSEGNILELTEYQRHKKSQASQE